MSIIMMKLQYLKQLNFSDPKLLVFASSLFGVLYPALRAGSSSLRALALQAYLPTRRASIVTLFISYFLLNEIETIEIVQLKSKLIF